MNALHKYKYKLHFKTMKNWKTTTFYALFKNPLSKFVKFVFPEFLKFS